MAHFETMDEAQPRASRYRHSLQTPAQVDPDDPFHISAERRELGERWHLAGKLMGGTRAMRDAAHTYLPQEPAETDEAYAVRIGRSFLFNGFRDTVWKLAGKPFTRDVKIKEETSPELLPLEKDVDLAGQNLTQFSLALLEHGWTYGLAHIFVEYPQAPAGLTLAEERARGLRPYLVEVHPEDILGWRSELRDGVETLTQLRRHECSEERDGAFGARLVHRVRVYDRVVLQDEETGEERVAVVWTLYERDAKGKAVVVGEGTLTISQIPLVTCYVRRTGLLMAEPPLDDLAWVNLAHWQSSSDQRNVLRIARAGIMFASGVSDEDLGKKIPFGPSVLLSSRSAESKLQWVEHQGSAIGAGRQDLLDLQDQMMMLGLEPMLHRPTGGVTATQAAIETAQSHSALRASVVALKQALEQALLLAGRWLDIPEPRAAVDINEDFGVSIGESRDIDSLIALRRAGELSRRRLWVEMQRRNVLGEDFDAEAEARGIASEASPAEGGGQG